MKIILPFRGEFGMKLMRHVPQVNAISACSRREKIVCCEPGEEAFYPSAMKFEICDKNDDDMRRESYGKDSGYISKYMMYLKKKYPKAEFVKTNKDMPCEYFIPKPYVTYDIKNDVVICPRKRNYGAEKNWKHWVETSKRLQSEGLNVFAAGAADSSYDVPCSKAWEYDRCLDATIDAIGNSKLVLATDAGIAHLAVQCGKPLIMISYKNGIVSPGPVRDKNGKVVKKDYWPIMLHRFKAENHTGSDIKVVHDSWDDVDKVIEEVLSRCL